ncbi:MAG: class I SAM-dependent methyltransferase [Nocardioidaceae bacterium]|nr:class I SAM-dependent methyltransferase [Nocardioidaceae bacterium]NUS51511.1 class I SAM-dependent methyltransferase [Nocardioidaceae bacterium]
MDAQAWDERYAATGLVWSATPNRFVEAELTGVAPGRALDLAAGEGRNALWLAERGWRVTAVDFSQVGLDKGRTLQDGHGRGADLDIDWVRADVLSFDPGPVRYDLVLMAYLQLVEDERRVAVRRGFEALADGGTLLWVAHDLTNLAEGTGGPTSAAVLSTAQDVLDDLAGEPVTVRRAERVARVVPPADPAHTHTGEEDRTAWDTLVRLERTPGL